MYELLLSVSASSMYELLLSVSSKQEFIH
jgi:hypothetical protein